jgi:phosphopantothenate synthetase
MQESPQQVINWAAVNTAIAIISGVVVAAAAYLRMFIKGEISVMERNIMEKIESKFSTKELVQEKLTNIERRLNSLENELRQKKTERERDDR